MSNPFSTKNPFDTSGGGGGGTGGPETDPVFTAAKPTLALKTDVSALATATDENIAAIEAFIPPEADPATNQLADKAFVNDSVTEMSAWKIYVDDSLNDFADAAELLAAVTSGTVYRADGQPWTPTVNDYAIVLSDATAPAPYTGEATRWKNFANVGWGYDFPLGKQENHYYDGSPYYEMQETTNRISTNGGTWTVDRKGSVNVILTAS